MARAHWTDTKGEGERRLSGEVCEVLDQLVGACRPDGDVGDITWRREGPGRGWTLYYGDDYDMFGILDGADKGMSDWRRGQWNVPALADEDDPLKAARLALAELRLRPDSHFDPKSKPQSSWLDAPGTWQVVDLQKQEACPHALVVRLRRGLGRCDICGVRLVPSPGRPARALPK